MDTFCGSPLWLHNLTWNTTSSPDFTPCFQETVLVWIPTFLLWCLAPLEVIRVYRSERSYIPVTLLNIFKAFLTTVLCLLSAGELIEAIARPDPSSEIPLVDYVTPIVKSLTYALVFALITFHRNRGVHSSGLLFLFWALIAVTSVINTRSLLLATFADVPKTNWHLTEFRLTLKLVSGPIVIIQLVLSCLADKRAEDPFLLTGEDFRNISPETNASVLSRLTFWWLNSLMLLGYKRALTQEDLFNVKTSDKTEIVVSEFDEILDVAIKEALEERHQDEQAANELDPAGKQFISGRNSPERTSWLPLIGRRSRNRAQSQRQQAAADSNGRNGKPKFDKQTLKSAPSAAADEEPAKYVGVTWLLVKSFWPALLLASFFKLVSSLLTFTSPIMLSAIISFVTNGDEPAWRGPLYAFMLFVLSSFDALFTQREQYLTSVNVMRIRTCLVSSLYRKTLRLSHQSRKSYTTGQIVNLMSVDCQRIADMVQSINNIWSAPLQLTISMVLLYQQLGMAIFAGLGVMIVNIPFNSWIAIKLRELQHVVMRYKDKRLKLLSEIFNGIKIVKIHAWEDSFRDRAESIRAAEIDSLTRQTWYSAAITFAFTCLPFIVAVASFTMYILLDPNNILDANRVFVSLSLFNIIRIPLAILPMLISNLSMFVVSVRRINKFLECDEIDPNAVKPIEDDESAVVKISGGSFKWERTGELVLDKIDLTVPRRKLVAVVGPVGSGKSSLVSTILGELERVEGQVQVDVSSSMAYVPQEAWILNTSLKNNILFNKVENESRYERVIDACALRPDLDTLQLGDRSEIGEKGINLSGGQKQRVSLARAVYADADVYLLDDPLNAVDAHVGRHIFDSIIGPRGMLRDRTRLLVTNNLSFLPEVDYILVMKEGQIVESGTYERLLKDGGAFSQLLVKYLLENSSEARVAEGSRADLITRELKRLAEKLTRQSQLHTGTDSKDTLHPSKMAASDTTGGGGGKQAGAKSLASHGEASGGGGGGNLTGQEVSQVGSVGLDVHMKFLRTMGINFMIALGIYILSSAFTISSNVWLSEWSNDALNETLKSDLSLRNLRLGVYAGLGFGESACVIVSTILLNLACIHGSQLLHNRMLGRVLRAPMAWFNTTPSGRIMNRFSKDIDTVDVTIRFNVRLLMVIALRSVTSLILISLGSAYSIMFIVPIVLMYFLFQIFYISTSRQLKRIESTTKSPIYSHFTETINGASSIRAFGVTREFILESYHRVDVNNASYYIGFVASRWLSIRLELLGFIVVLVTSLIAVYSRGIISPGIAGLTVTYSLTLTMVMSFLVRTYSDYETNVVSVERLLEYTQLPVEPEDDEEPADPNWPAQGRITFDKFSARYRPELELVLRQFSLKVEASQKVGLVGRTGAGKSSITLALFRILEASEGCIVIDDVNIGHINLRILRSKLSIIPQEPILFTGTIRQNVDPTQTYPDHEIWTAIDLAHLGPFVRSLGEGLDHEVTEGGNNFSVGQKQLFCLARALLRRSKILVLDEATAAVDVETDDLIQQTIRREFRDSTVVTIAHRLETIQDYDRVVVLEQGQLAEQGAPSELMRRNTSKFRNLARESGLIK